MLASTIIICTTLSAGEPSNRGQADGSNGDGLGGPWPVEAWFFPDAGPERAVIAPDGTMGGLPVRRTGAIVVRSDDPEALAALPWVARVEGLGHGDEIFRLHTQPGTDELQRSRQLHERADIAWAHPDLALELVLHELPDDPYLGEQWHLENTGQGGWTEGADIDAETAWALATGVGGLIAVLDSGVDQEHPDLVASSGYDYVGRDDDSSPDVEADDSAAHGTCVAGVAAATGDNATGVAGVAYDAEVYGIRMIGGYTTTGDIYDAFVEAVDAGAWVLNNSWGYADCPDYMLPASWRSALEYAEEEGRGGLGTAIVASAGNDNCDGSEDGFLDYWTIIGVAATDGHDERAPYSNYGSIVDISAPSGGIVTTDISGEGGYGDYGGDVDYIGWFSGTSAAAPVVSGVLTLMFDANPRLTAAQAREVICDTAVRVSLDGADYDAQGWNEYYGCGRIDAGAAVLAVANEAPLQPVLSGPGAHAYEDRVVLSWEPAPDADGDWLDYQVSWWIGDDSAAAELRSTRASLLDITDSVQAGDFVSWRVTPLDLWGQGEPSAVGSFEVLAIPDPPAPEQPGGCATTGSRRGLGLALLGLAALVCPRRRRTSRNAGE
jgi:subtilisin family serine protease